MKFCVNKSIPIGTVQFTPKRYVQFARNIQYYEARIFLSVPGIALQLERYEHLSVQSLYDKFVLNGADVIIQEDAITVQLKKKRNLPLILEVMQTFSRQKYPWLNGKNVIFEGATYS